MPRVLCELNLIYQYLTPLYIFSPLTVMGLFFPRQRPRNCQNVFGRAVFLWFVAAMAMLAFLAPQEGKAARLFTSGFETGGILNTEWDTVFHGSFSTTTVHSGTYAFVPESLINGDGGYVGHNLAAAKISGTLYSRGYLFWSAFPNAPSVCFEDINSAHTAVGFELFVTSTQKVVLKNEVTGTVQKSATTLSLNTWYRFEVRHLLASSGGELEMRMYRGDASSPLETLTITNENTLPTDIIDVQWGDPQGGGFQTHSLIDDVAINDESGTFQNSWPGAGSINLLKPTFDTSVAWTRNPVGSSNAQDVADVPNVPDDDATYNSISDTVSQDKFYLSELTANVPANASMTLAQVFARAGSNQAAADTIRLLWWNENDTQITGPAFSVAVNGYRLGNTSEFLVVNLSTTTRTSIAAAKIGYMADSGTGLLKKVTALWANVEYTGAAPTSGLQVSSRSDTLSDSRPSVSSNKTFVFTTNSAISASSTMQLTWPPGYLFSSALSCGDVDVATGTQFALTATSVGCEATATAWGAAFVSSTRSFILTAPWKTGIYVATGTQITMSIGSNATFQQQGTYWISNPASTGVYTISVGGTFGGSGNMLVSINAGVTVQATVAESLAFTVSSVKAVNCSADDGATVTAVDTTSTTIPFGNVSLNTFYIGCQDLIVSTNAGNGYSITTQESSVMKTANGSFTIPDTTCDAGTCSESAAAAWTSATHNGLGHTCFNQDGNHDCDSSYSNGTKFRQFANIAAGETAQAIMSSTTPATVTARIKHRLSVGAAQVAGTYTTLITYTILGTF